MALADGQLKGNAPGDITIDGDCVVSNDEGADFGSVATVSEPWSVSCSGSNLKEAVTITVENDDHDHVDLEFV